MIFPRITLSVSLKIIGAIILVIAGFLAVRFASNPNSPYTRTTPLAADTVISTGAADESLSATTQSHLNLSQQLSSRLPISQSGFSITFDYEQDEFLVTLNTPFSTSQSAFYTWLSSQGYASLPKDYFQIQLNNSVSPTSIPTPTPFSPTPTLSPSTPTSSPTPTSPPAQSNLITLSISTPADDVNQDGTRLYSNDSYLWIGSGASFNFSYTMLRFTTVNLPQNATITSATLKLYSPTQQWIPLNLSLAAEAANNSAPITSTSKPSTRTITHSISHTSNTQWSPNSWYTLDDLSPLIQEVISRPGWRSGNALSLIFKGTGSPWSRKYFHSQNLSPQTSPQLIITYR